MSEVTPICVCYGTGWVCEEHNDKPWAGMMPDGFVECCGGAGEPCKKCNPSDRDNPPRFGDMDEVYADVNDPSINALHMANTRIKELEALAKTLLDALHRVNGYAEHDEECPSNKVFVDCNCGYRNTMMLKEAALEEAAKLGIVV